MNEWSPFEIEKALALLPLLEEGDFIPYRWAGGETATVNGWEVTRFPYPDEGHIAGATLRQIGRYFALCRRGERFCDGFIAKEFDEGRIVGALRRLREVG